jgi:hypothetical protein
MTQDRSTEAKPRRSRGGLYLLALVVASGIGAVFDALFWPEHSVGLKIGLLVGPLAVYLWLRRKEGGA